MPAAKPPLKASDLVELGVDPQHAADWLQTRAGKGCKVLTVTAWNRHCTEAAKAGITPAAAVQFCCEVGDWGFYADKWARMNPTATGTPRTFKQVDKKDASNRLAKLTAGILGTGNARPIDLFDDQRPAAEIMEGPNHVRRLSH